MYLTAHFNFLVALHYEEYAIALSAALNGKPFKYIAAFAPLLDIIKTATDSVSAVGIEWYDSFAAEIVCGQKALHWRRQLHTPRWRSQKHAVVSADIVD